ncbi:TPA: VanZ family protein [Stenotrophomonas maltophilia]|nr:VanZ family protein [Stenotrophomonas maltophilia]HDS1027855.1 VanZ family protein [Stenotrophomonas maltophilia]HDS1032032.1 VanZ family protein [Stenotrophomonas maltophilia]HDS1036602.1 VanZ family protein [Stenotrophomonas maltophilia]
MSAALPVIKPLRRPRLWAALWLLAVLIVIVACLIPPPPIPLPENGDKGEHFLAYFILSGSAVQLFRRGRPLLWVGVGLVLMGVCIEFAQGALTSNRSADPMDALANTIGVLSGMGTVLTPLRDILLRWRG